MCFLLLYLFPLYSSENNMDPGPVPLELQGLTQVEEKLRGAYGAERYGKLGLASLN